MNRNIYTNTAERIAETLWQKKDALTVPDVRKITNSFLTLMNVSSDDADVLEQQSYNLAVLIFGLIENVDPTIDDALKAVSAIEPLLHAYCEAVEISWVDDEDYPSMDMLRKRQDQIDETEL